MDGLGGCACVERACVRACVRANNHAWVTEWHNKYNSLQHFVPEFIMVYFIVSICYVVLMKFQRNICISTVCKEFTCFNLFAPRSVLCRSPTFQYIMAIYFIITIVIIIQIIVIITINVKIIIQIIIIINNSMFTCINVYSGHFQHNILGSERTGGRRASGHGSTFLSARDERVDSCKRVQRIRWENSCHHI